MNSLEIGRLHERAAALYVEGRYVEAKRAWEEILDSVPDEPSALEGVSLVRALCARIPCSAEDDPDLDNEDGAADPEHLLARVGEHLQASRYGAALAAARRLSETAPMSELGQELVHQAVAKLESAPFIAAELAAAKHALQLSMWDTGRQACRTVLAIDPEHQEATALLRLADVGEEWAAEQGLHADSAVVTRKSAAVDK